MTKEQKHIFLTPEEEQSLFAEYKKTKNPRLHEKIVLAHLPLANATARKMAKSNGFEYDDLAQEAILGLYKALENFDPDKGVYFGVYAKLYVKAAIAKYLMENWTIVKNGSRVFKENFYKNKRAYEELSRLGYDNTEVLSEEVAKEYTNYNTTASLEQISKRDLSLNAPLSHEDGKGDHMDMLQDYDEDPEQTLINKITYNQYLEAFYEMSTNMSDKQIELIKERLFSDSRDSFRKLSDKIGCSHETLRKIEINFLQDVGKFMNEKMQKNKGIK